MALSTLKAGPGIGNQVNRIRTERGTVHQMTAESLSALEARIQRLEASVNAAIGAINGTPVGFSITTQEVALVTATTTNIVPANLSPADDDVLLVVTTQDATGGGKITWHASFKGVTPDDNDETATVLSSYFFIGRGGFWTIAALPRLGFAP